MLGTFKNMCREYPLKPLWNNSRNGLDPSIISGLQALGDVIGFTYGKRGKQTTGHDNRRRVIFGSKDRLINFLNDMEVLENRAGT